MHQYNLYEAKTRLSQLVQAALDGEEVLIARAGKPAVRLVPVGETTPATIGYGCLKLAPGALDQAFTPETDAEVAALFMGKDAA
ncbi:MAG: type II toxin-antitoxin system prevent-host-death family antitoxin [Pseudomonadota bacterium]|jgi:prevent-host-death family protein